MTFDGAPPCAEDPELPFVADYGVGRLRTLALRECKALCLRCPDRVECLARGVEADVYGVWGGLTSRERKTVRKRFRIEPIVLGAAHREIPDHAHALRTAVTVIREERAAERARLHAAVERAHARAATRR